MFLAELKMKHKANLRPTAVKNRPSPAATTPQEVKPGAEKNRASAQEKQREPEHVVAEDDQRATECVAAEDNQHEPERVATEDNQREHKRVTTHDHQRVTAQDDQRVTAQESDQDNQREPEPFEAPVAEGAKYEKMLKIGTPLPAVLRKMGQDAIDIRTINWESSFDEAAVEMYYRPAYLAATGKPAAATAQEVPRRKIHADLLPWPLATMSIVVNEGDVPDTVWTERENCELTWSESSDLMMDQILARTSRVKPTKQQTDAAQGQAPSTRGPGVNPPCLEFILPKRSQNIAILLHGLKLTASEHRQRLHSFAFDNKLSGSLHSLIKEWPPSDELIGLKSFQGDASKLAKADRFFLEMIDIPRLKLKFECVMFSLNFTARYSNLLVEMRGISTALRWFISRHDFRTMLQRILKLVCYGNSNDKAALGTTRVGSFARGLRLSSLPVLVRTKSADSSVTLLQLIVKALQESDPKASSFAQELLKMTRVLTGTSIHSIRSEIVSFDAGYKLIYEEAKAAGSDREEFGYEDDGVHYQDRIKQCAGQSELELLQLHHGLRELDTAIRGFTAYFEETEPAKITDLISNISTFVEAYAIEVDAADRKRSNERVANRVSLPSTESTASSAEDEVDSPPSSQRESDESCCSSLDSEQ